MIKLKVGDNVRAFGCDGVVKEIENDDEPYLVDFGSCDEIEWFRKDGKVESWHKTISLEFVSCGDGNCEFEEMKCTRCGKQREPKEDEFEEVTMYEAITCRGEAYRPVVSTTKGLFRTPSSIMELPFDDVVGYREIKVMYREVKVMMRKGE